MDMERRSAASAPLRMKCRLLHRQTSLLLATTPIRQRRARLEAPFKLWDIHSQRLATRPRPEPAEGGRYGNVGLRRPFQSLTVPGRSDKAQGRLLFALWGAGYGLLERQEMMTSYGKT